MNAPWFLLFDGDSEDGRGDPKYIGRTMRIQSALDHFRNVKGNPYSIGRVDVVTDNSIMEAWEETCITGPNK